MATVFRDQRTSFYCGCSFEADGRIDWASCGYIPRANSKRARRIEWEHVVPAHAFGQSFPEWRQGHPSCVNTKGKAYKGRRCVRKVSAAFRRMEADLYNLQPAIGEVNADRSNYSMAELEGEEREYGACDVEIRERKIEPRPSVRGDIARTYFYMDKAYPGRGIIGAKRRKLFEAWAKADPIDAWERKRVQAIQAIQGNRNPAVP
ncbi:MAG: endonuclease I [Myxococcales bacterium]|nr:endonuclease I [Myxococcales bacterium]